MFLGVLINFVLDNAHLLPAGTDPSGTHRIRSDFCPIHWKAGSRLFSCCKCEHRPPPPKGNKRESTSTPGLGEPSERAVRAEASCCSCLQLGWNRQAGGTLAGYQEVLGPSLHSSAWAAAAPSHIPNVPWWWQWQQSCQPNSPALWQRWRRQQDVGSFPPTDELLLTLALSTPGLGLATVNIVF